MVRTAGGERCASLVVPAALSPVVSRSQQMERGSRRQGRSGSEAAWYRVRARRAQLSTRHLQPFALPVSSRGVVLDRWAGIVAMPWQFPPVGDPHANRKSLVAFSQKRRGSSRVPAVAIRTIATEAPSHPSYCHRIHPFFSPRNSAPGASATGGRRLPCHPRTWRQ